MFFVLTRSPRRVEHFSSYLDEFRLSDFHISKREAREKKINKIKIVPPRLCLKPFFVHFYVFFLIKSETHMSLFFQFLILFSSETNHFIPVSILFIIIEYSLNIYHFLKFFSNPVFRFHSTPAAYKFIKYFECFEI